MHRVIITLWLLQIFWVCRTLTRGQFEIGNTWSATSPVTKIGVVTGAGKVGNSQSLTSEISASFFNVSFHFHKRLFV
jgi:hypothetical protein